MSQPRGGHKGHRVRHGLVCDGTVVGRNAIVGTGPVEDQLPDGLDAIRPLGYHSNWGAEEGITGKGAETFNEVLANRLGDDGYIRISRTVICMSHPTGGPFVADSCAVSHNPAEVVHEIWIRVLRK